MTESQPEAVISRAEMERNRFVHRIQDNQAFARAIKNVPGRETAEKIRAIGMSICEVHIDEISESCLGCMEGRRISQSAEFMLDFRQATRGGKKNVKGSRHWEDE